EHAADALVVLAQLLGVVGIVDRQHLHAVPHLLEARDGLAAHALSGTVGRDEVRMGGLEFFQFFEQSVELEVGNLRTCLDVVEVVMTVDLAAQFLDPLLGSFHGTPWEVARDGYLTSLPAFSLAPRGFASAVGGRPATCSPVPGRPSRRLRPATTSSRPGARRRATPTAERGCPPQRPFPPASAPVRRPVPSGRRRD